MSGTANISAPGVQTASAPEGYRFPRTNKLLKHALFDQVYQRGQRHFSGLMTVFFLKRGEASDVGLAPRVGLTVGRVLGNSVVRNRIRRRVREAVRLNLNRLTLPVDVVINPKKAVVSAEFSRIEEEVHRAFEAVVKRAEAGKEVPAADSGGIQQLRRARKGRKGSKPHSPKQGGAA